MVNSSPLLPVPERQVAIVEEAGVGLIQVFWFRSRGGGNDRVDICISLFTILK